MNCNFLILTFCMLFQVVFSQSAPIGNKMDDYSPRIEKKKPKVKTNQTTKTQSEVVATSSKTKSKKKITKSSKIKNPVTKPLFSIHDHAEFNELLNKYVSSQGFVDYKGLKSDEDKLDTYLKSLAENYIQASWSRNQKLAYWINVYNAYTLKLILKNYPLKSITDIDNGNPWDTKWIQLGGKSLSLNNIENDIIRPSFNEPRIHFAVNCAAKSCPPLMNQAFVANKLENQLESQTKNFLNNSSYNTITSSKVTVSKIFEWYRGDFGNLGAFINKYTKEDTGNASIEFNEYNWNLNGK